MANFNISDNKKITQKVLLLSRISTYIFLAYILTDVTAGGDLKHIIPYISFSLSMLYMILRRDFQLFRSSLFYALAGYVVVSYLLVPFSFDPGISLAATNKNILNSLFLFVAMYVHTSSQKETELMMGYLMFILAFVLFGAYYTSFSEFNAGIAGRHWFYPNVKLAFVKFKMHYNGFAMLVNMFIPLMIASLIQVRADEKRKKSLVIILLVLSVVAVFLSLSRGGWAVLIIMFVPWAFYPGKNVKHILTSLGYYGIITFLLIGLVWVAVPSFRLTIAQTGEQFRTVNERTVIWHRVVRAIEASPLYGWGLGDRIVWDEKPYVIKEEEKKLVFDKIGYHSHNMILHVLYHQGIIGLFFFGLFIGTSFLSALRGIKRSRGNAADQAFFFSVVCIFISLLFLHGMIEIVYFTWICFIIGFLSGQYSRCGLALAGK